jgi:hypothetical protein
MRFLTSREGVLFCEFLLRGDLLSEEREAEDRRGFVVDRGPGVTNFASGSDSDSLSGSNFFVRILLLFEPALGALRPAGFRHVFVSLFGVLTIFVFRLQSKPMLLRL